jgi:hypothetical protein
VEQQLCRKRPVEVEVTYVAGERGKSDSENFKPFKGLILYF